MLAALLQTAAALTVLNVAPRPVKHSDSAGAATARGFGTGWMIQPDQAQRFLTLQHQSHPTESLGCMIAKSFTSPCSLRGFLQANGPRVQLRRPPLRPPASAAAGPNADRGPSSAATRRWAAPRQLPARTRQDEWH